MPELPDFFVARTAASTAFLQETFELMVANIRALNNDAATACHHAGRIATGGKHLRATLVHIGADRPESAAIQPPDTAVAAAFDLLHAAFLVLDDVIDDDETRRGEPTIHAATRDQTGDAHYGQSVAILVGTATMNEAVRIVLDCGAPADTTLSIVQHLLDATADSMMGEFMDIHHSLPTVHPTEQRIQLAAQLKTSTYSFEAPLACGALLANHQQRIPELTSIGRHLGCAYQLANDLHSAFSSLESTGKTPGGDLLHHRATMLTAAAQNTDHWPEIAHAISTKDIPRAQHFLRQSGAISHVTNQANYHVEAAATIMEAVELSPAGRTVLRNIAHTITESLAV